MKRWLPSSPLLSAALLALWLLLNPGLTFGNLLLGAVVALLAPRLTAPLRPEAPGPRRPGVVLRLALTVGRDVVVSNLQVARGVLLAPRRQPRAAFLTLPIDLRSPQGLAALAVITTVIPGTVWCELSPDHRQLLLHVFDLDDELLFVDHYKHRYELPLRRIFDGLQEDAATDADAANPSKRPARTVVRPPTDDTP